MRKKYYEAPKIDVIVIETEDILTTSSGDEYTTENGDIVGPEL